MKRHMADIHFHRARLFGLRINDVKYPWESHKVDHAAAEKFINDCGYHRRDEELTDAKKALLSTDF